MSEETKTRRRGAELEAAILDAAWQQLVDEGFDRFTIDAVAERAGTSKPVLYRRWSTRQELLRATIHGRGTTRVPPVFDSGSLREDVLAALRYSNANRGDVGALLNAMMSSHFDDVGMTPAELRAELFVDRKSTVEEALGRAIARGEIDPAVVTPRIADLPFTLFRHEWLMTLEPVPDETLQEFVDDIFMPLLRRN